MGWFTATKDIDQQRLVVAVHELGHAVAHTAAGFPLREIRVTGAGDRARGSVSLGYVEHTDEVTIGYLVGIMAGREAEYRWCDHHNIPRRGEYAFATDRKLFRRWRRTLKTSRLTENQARTVARSIVTSHWARITRLAPRLARTGRLTHL